MIYFEWSKLGKPNKLWVHYLGGFNCCARKQVDTFIKKRKATSQLTHPLYSATETTYPQNQTSVLSVKPSVCGFNNSLWIFPVWLKKNNNKKTENKTLF